MGMSQSIPPQVAAQMAQRAGQSQTAQGNTSSLPAGIDPRAVAANPQGYQQWLAGAKAQEAAMPGSTLLASQAAQRASQQGMPSSSQGISQTSMPMLASDPRSQQALAQGTTPSGMQQSYLAQREAQFAAQNPSLAANLQASNANNLAYLQATGGNQTGMPSSPQGGGDMTRQAPMLSQAAQGGMGQPVQGGQQLVQGGNMGAAIPQEFFNKWQQQNATQPSGQSVPNPTTNQATIDAMRQEVARSRAAGGVGQKGGQPPSPQQLGQGLQQQAMMQGQMPLSNQRQPQGRMPPRMPMRGRR